MKHIKRSLVAMILIVAALLLVACGQGDEAAVEEEPAIVEEISGSDFNRVILTQKAAERLGIQTESASGGQSVTVPYSAIIYGLNGETWVYTSPETLTFIRQPVTVDRIEGGQVILSDGPPSGTEVVTVGAALLLGADTGVGK
jgi:outer membrane lipoprotein-sorting protein